MSRPSDPTARLKLLAAAEAVFAARGLDEAKIEDIAARAGLGKGSFYLHFESKDDAFRQLVEVMLSKMKAQIEAMCDDNAVPAGVPLGQLLDQWVKQDTEIFEFVWQNRALVGLMLEGGRCAAYRHLIDGFCDEAVEKTKRLVRSGIRAGIYRDDLDVDVTASFIGGAYDRLARQIVRQPRRPELEQMLRRVQFLVLRGVASADTLAEIATMPATLPITTKRRRPSRTPAVLSNFANARPAAAAKRPVPAAAKPVAAAPMSERTARKRAAR
jgi:AcrR family transcriptional regulator